MPKQRRTKPPDFLQFRPYHAFTSHADRPAKAAGTAKWWLLMVVVAALLALAVLWLSHGR